jgi:hypothetical protein
MPFSLGRPMSSKIKFGFSAWAFSTASNPSEASPMTRKSGLLSSFEQTNRLNGPKSSTTRTVDMLIPSERTRLASSRYATVPTNVEHVFGRSRFGARRSRNIRALIGDEIRRLHSQPGFRCSSDFQKAPPLVKPSRLRGRVSGLRWLPHARRRYHHPALRGWECRLAPRVGQAWRRGFRQ